MSFHPEKIYGDGLLVTRGRREVLISVSDGEEITAVRIFDFDEARLIAEDILQCVKDGDCDA